MNALDSGCQLPLGPAEAPSSPGPFIRRGPASPDPVRAGRTVATGPGLLRWSGSCELRSAESTLPGMGRNERTLERVLRGTSDRNIAFRDLRRLVLWLGFGERIRGDHHIFTKDGVEEILNLQPKGSKAKPYQVKQVREVILRYKLGGDENG
jgi:hypothetical protein